MNHIARGFVGFIALAFGPQALATPTLPVPPGLDAAWAKYRSSESHLAPGRRFPHQRCFEQAARAHDVPLALLLAVARGESDFDPRAVSKANAIGVMQILWPGTARHLAIDDKSALYEPCINIDAGARYLNELMTRYDGDLHRTLAAYNYGPGRVPTGDGDIPRGAQWYSGYIYRHLSFVLGKNAAPAGDSEPAPYDPDRKKRLISFNTPYRAAAFVDNLQRQVPTMPVDWFREHATLFHVVLSYSNEPDLKKKRQALRNIGFVVR
jgi:hypothetical protein